MQASDVLLTIRRKFLSAAVLRTNLARLLGSEGATYPGVNFALFCSGVLLLTSCDKTPSKPPQPPKAEVDVVVLHPQAVTLTTQLPGRTTAFRVAEVRPQVSGVILKRMFIEGDTVKEGQQLYQIDPAPYQASLASAQATLAHARAATAVNQLTADRYKRLTTAGAISRQDLDNAVATLRQSQADIASAEAAIKTAAINLNYTKLRSPISGRSGRSTVTEGALVTANQSNTLVTITELTPIYVDVVQPSTTILRLKRELASGQIKNIGQDRAVVRLILEDGTPYELPGTLQFSEVTVDQGTGSVTIRAIFPNNHGLLLPGMFVQEVVEEGVRQNSLLVPQQGVTHNTRGEATALVVGPDNKVVTRILTTDRAIGDKWLVTKGLNDGDRVIVEGLQKARPGAEVTAKEVSLDAAEPAADGQKGDASSPNAG